MYVSVRHMYMTVSQLYVWSTALVHLSYLQYRCAASSRCVIGNLRWSCAHVAAMMSAQW